MQKVLLIEDDETMLSLIRTLLEMEGYQVVLPRRKENLDGILNIARQEMPALILLDVHLNHLNGFDLLRGIRQDVSLKPVRVLMSSGMDLTFECMNAGADSFILKPYMPDELMDKIRYLLGE